MRQIERLCWWRGYWSDKRGRIKPSHRSATVLTIHKLLKDSGWTQWLSTSIPKVPAEYYSNKQSGAEATWTRISGQLQSTYQYSHATYRSWRSLKLYQEESSEIEIQGVIESKSDKRDWTIEPSIANWAWLASLITTKLLSIQINMNDQPG